jgi:Putative quorum-sensing-regulated virulence factor
MAYLMPFGRYKGRAITQVPRAALEHYLNWDQLRDDTRHQIQTELASRDAGPGGRERVQAPPGDPDRGPAVSPAGRPPRNRPGGNGDPTASLRRRRQLCAEDVIAAGEKMLTATVPHQAPMIQEASTFLRDLLRQAGDKPVDRVDNSVEEDPNAAPF